jgi:hypothetical protein
MNWLFKILIALAVIALLFATYSTQFVQARENNKELLGSWSVEVTLTDLPPFAALLTFTSDGSVISDEQMNPVETPGHGNWVSKGPGKVAYTFVAFMGNADGTLNSTIKVIGILKYDSGKHSWSGPMNVTQTDLEGNVLFSATGSFKLNRIAVESLP